MKNAGTSDCAVMGMNVGLFGRSVLYYGVRVRAVFAYAKNAVRQIGNKIRVVGYNKDGSSAGPASGF
jgi:hypothetical protein